MRRKAIVVVRKNGFSIIQETTGGITSREAQTPSSRQPHHGNGCSADGRWWSSFAKIAIGLSRDHFLSSFFFRLIRVTWVTSRGVKRERDLFHSSALVGFNMAPLHFFLALWSSFSSLILELIYNYIFFNLICCNSILKFISDNLMFKRIPNDLNLRFIFN